MPSRDLPQRLPTPLRPILAGISKGLKEVMAPSPATKPVDEPNIIETTPEEISAFRQQFLHLKIASLEEDFEEYLRSVHGISAGECPLSTSAMAPQEEASHVEVPGEDLAGNPVNIVNS